MLIDLANVANALPHFSLNFLQVMGGEKEKENSEWDVYRVSTKGPDLTKVLQSNCFVDVPIDSNSEAIGRLFIRPSLIEYFPWPNTVQSIP